ncbi:hypothetical protein [Aequorivita sinensis]|uniref:hypothetical protein n=1 Tax=Aequorivita sinensis TaxID=1382458 RepID=UPI00111ED213|nr:hypothetical protein [Aequorivita sinensis]
MKSTPDYAAATTITGLPNGNVDRVALRVGTLYWKTEVINQINNTPPTDISVKTIFNPGTCNLSMTVTADFFTALSGDYTLGAVVVEDVITGTSSGYD